MMFLSVLLSPNLRKAASHLKNNSLSSPHPPVIHHPYPVTEPYSLTHLPLASVGHCLHNLFSVPAPTLTPDYLLQRGSGYFSSQTF
jgi:hypothetical protein